MPSVTLNSGTIHYEKSGPPDGHPLVFVHGYMMGASLWRPLCERLSKRGFLCFAPTWPLGAQPEPMRQDADLTMEGIAAIVGDFLDSLDLEDVVLVGNDTGGAVAQILATTADQRLAGLVLTSCDAFEHFPPPIISPLIGAARARPSFLAALQPLRTQFARRRAFWALAHEDIDPLVREWLGPPLSDSRVRADLRRFTELAEPPEHGASRRTSAAVHEAGADRVVGRRRVLPARRRQSPGRRPAELTSRGDPRRQDVLDDRPAGRPRRPDCRIRRR